LPGLFIVNALVLGNLSKYCYKLYVAKSSGENKSKLTEIALFSSSSSSSSELIMGHIFVSHFCDPWPTWPVSQLTRDPHDPWPIDPVPENGMSRSRVLTNHDEFTTIAFYSVQSGILDMAYAVYSKSSNIHSNCYKLNTVNSSLSYTVYTPP